MAGRRRMIRKRRAVRKRAPARRRLQILDPKAATLAAQITGAKVASAAYNRYQRSKKAKAGQQGSVRSFGGGRSIPFIAPEEEQGTGAYSQWTQRYASGRFGKLTGRKIDKLSLDKVIYTHRRIGPFNDNGQFYLSNFQESNGNVLLPCMLFELNSCKNNIDGSVGVFNPVHRLYQSTNTMGWLDVGGQDTDGTTLVNDWRTERSPHTTSSTLTYPGDQAIHLWSSLDLELWGCKNKPTKYDIMLVQFSEDVLPNYSTAQGSAAEFWQGMMKYFTYSPLAKMENGFSTKKYKIMKHYKVNIDPTASFENDADPHVQTMKLFYRFNRKCNFQWQFNNPAGQTVAEFNDADWQQEDAQNQCQVHPNARMYIMIRASNYTRVVSPAVVDNTTNPSISWRLRTSYLINQ